MNRKILAGFTFGCSFLAMLLATPASAQSAFFQAVTNLNPVAYWPLQETTQPPAADVEQNRGSLGAAANAYFSSTNVSIVSSGANADSSDAYAAFDGANGGFLAVPMTDSRVSLPAGPFTVEAWVNPANTNNLIPIISQTGANPGGVSGGTYRGGWVLSQNYYAYQDVAAPQGWSFHVYNGQGAGNGLLQGGAEAGVSYAYSAGSWYYLAAVFDGTNCTLYINGTNVNSANDGYQIPMTGSYVRDTWDPLCIGCGRGINANRFTGGIDEVAIYTNALTAAQIQAHYNAANNSYSSTIMGDKPYMYWRMDASGYTDPDNSTFPVAANYGSDTSLSGLYLPGTIPGVAGPSYAGLGSPSYACAFNGIGTDLTNMAPVYTNGIYAFNVQEDTGVMITNTPDSLNLTNASVTAMCWFKANPADTRYQGLLGHGNGSWKLSLNTDGHIRWTPGEGGDFESSGFYNDGNWHFLVGVYYNSGMPASPAGVLATNYIYVDGVLDNSELLTNASASGKVVNTVLGGVGDYFYSGTSNSYNQRYFSGSLAQVAYFTNTLTASQVRSLYATAGATIPPPTITAQPYPYPSVRQVVAGAGVYIYEAVVAYGGTPNLYYQWYSNTSSNYTGATTLTDDGVHYMNSTTSQVTITNLSGGSAYYFCVVSNDYGATTSSIVNVQVYDSPVITAQSPSGAFTLYSGQSPTLSVTATGEANLIYQWFTNGVADTTAGVGANYSLAAVQAQSGETFQCIVTNSIGSATSTLATVTFQALPTAVANSQYATNILALNPTVYFPMHETTPAVRGDIETNYGTLGRLGDGTYADWNVNNGNPGNQWFIHQFSGALVGDTDTSLSLLGNNAGNGNSHLLIPHASPLATLKPPFTIEFWLYPNNLDFGDIISQDGTWLNAGNATHQNTDGIRVVWNRGNIQLYGAATINTTGTALTLYQWHHVALTYDGTNMFYYVDGNQDANGTTSSFTPDYWDPLLIGAGFWKNTGGGNYNIPFGIDEVAIYNTNLDGGTIYTHYSDGNNGSSGQYVTDVTSLHPLMYYRMDAPTYTMPVVGSWPVMTNYGTAAFNGVYAPGSVPGGVAGPSNGSGILSKTFSGTNALFCNGLSTFAEAYNPDAFDPVGPNTPFTVSMWFKGSPADASRYQSLASEGTGWEINQGQDGRLQFYLNSAFNSAGVYNDGLWHQVVVTYSTNVLAMYVDGLLDNMATNVAYTNPPSDTVDYTGIGCDTRYLANNQNGGSGRQYAGSVCEFAFWNGTTLNSNQVAALYSVSGMTPSITIQPVSANVNARTLFTNTVAATGPGAISYQWYRDGQPLPIGGQTNLINGATNASLIFDPVFATDASSDYYVVASNNYGSVTSSIVSLTVNTTPTFDNEPTDSTYTNDITLFVGATPKFSASASGALPIYYQWFTNGVAATTNGTSLTSYTLDPVQMGGVASVYCVASNFVGQTPSTTINLTVIPVPTAPYPQAVLNDKPIGYWRLNEANVDNFNNGTIADDYWGGNNGIYTNTTLGQSSYSTGTDPGTTSAEFGFDAFVDNDAYGIGGVDFGSTTNTSVNFTIEAWVNGYPQTKAVGLVTKGYGNGGEQFNLDTGSGAASDGHGFRFFVRDANGSVHGVSSTISPSYGAWHHLVGVCDESNGLVSFYIDGAVAGTASITPGSGILPSDRLMTIGSRTSSSTTTSNDLQYVGLESDVAVYNYALSANQVAVQYAQADVPPNLSTVPTNNVTVDGFGTLVLPTIAVGTPILSYTWYDQNNGTNIATGSTNGVMLDATLTVNSVPLNWNNDTLELTVQNSYGTTNYYVTLTVNTNAPQITSNLPAKVTVPTGKNYNYSIGAVGAQPIHYQWYNGVTLLTGETNTVYSVSTGSPGASTYYVVLTNMFGSVTSTVSTLTIVVPPTNSYAASILALSPVGYWPLQETNPPALVTMETNYGTLGASGAAYYAGTNAAALGVLGGNVSFDQTPGALAGATGDNDPAVKFVGGNNLNETNSYLFVPITKPVLALNGPVTYECWVNSSSGGFADLIGNGGANGDGSANWSGLRLSWNRASSIQVYWYAGSSSPLSIDSGAGTITGGVWYYVAVTYDGTNITLYVNGVQEHSAAATIAPNYWTPLSIGCGRWDGAHETRAYDGLMDEVAIYTNALTPTQIMNHYLSGTTSGSNYVMAVTNDKPLLYYRMDDSFTNVDTSTYPIAVNYGSAPVNGAYQPGTVPGGVSGPTITALGTNSVAAPVNGVFSCVDAGYDPGFNPTGTQPFTAMTWFRGNPWDNRTQAIMGQGGNWALNIVGTSGAFVWNLYNAGQVSSTSAFNDGNWHLVAGVYDGANIYLYVDGVLNNSTAAAGGLAGDTNNDLYLGGDSLYLYPQSGGAGTRYFAGDLAQAAFFTNALTADQIQALYSGASPTPTVSMAASGGNITITYTGTLLSSTNVTGPYTPVSGASSPYPVTPAGAQMFYRASVP